ncbi:MAG: fructose-6-phosphate aldolase [Candidatus Norongarragalinales archaeon]
MKLFIDSASVNEVREAVSWGIISGVTTNPSLALKAGKPYKESVLEIARLVDGPISVEGIAMKAPEIVKEAKEIASWHKNFVVKVPMTEEGIKAITELSKMGIKTNVTLVFSVNQALLAALAGATFVSPFIGRLDDNGQDGMQLIRDLMLAYRNYGFEKRTQVIVASVRHPLHVVEAAKTGAPIATVPFSVLRQMFKHSLTDAGIKKFIEDHAALEAMHKK